MSQSFQFVVMGFNELVEPYRNRHLVVEQEKKQRTTTFFCQFPKPSMTFKHFKPYCSPLQKLSKLENEFKSSPLFLSQNDKKPPDKTMRVGFLVVLLCDAILKIKKFHVVDVIPR